jgi:hypothetical protein
MLENNVITDRSDCYSLGVVLWELFTGQEPWRVRSDALGEVWLAHMCRGPWSSPREGCWGSCWLGALPEHT